jgi:hypothetical protein
MFATAPSRAVVRLCVVAWLHEKLRSLAAEARLLVVTDRVTSARSSSDDCADWNALLAGLGRLRSTTVVSITADERGYVEVAVRCDAQCFRSLTTSDDAGRLLTEMHRRQDAATIYIGDGAHATSLERRLGARDATVTNWRPCGHQEAISISDLDKARPILEMLYLLRRESARASAARDTS